MLKLEDAPNMAPDPEVTYWLGDPAIDRENSNVALWAETGSIDALGIKTGGKPSVIEYRVIDEFEVGALPVFVKPSELPWRLFNAARRGLVSIDGLDLNVATVNGHRLIAESQAKAIDAKFRSTFPMWLTMNAWGSTWYGDDWVALPKPKGDENEEAGLMVWLGAQILIRSFPGR